MNKKSVIAMTMMVVLLLLVVGCGSTNSKTSNTNIRENTNSGKGKVNIVRSPVSDVTKPIIVMHQGDQAILDAFPESMNDEVFIPVQNVCQILGAQLEWDEKTNVATISRTGSQVKMTIGN